MATHGTTAFLHVLDSTQAKSTGPVRYAPASSGEYLHYQANINTTNCNMLPATTPTYDTLVHVRMTLHRGERTNGSLIGGMTLPDQGAGCYHPYAPGERLNSDDWGGAESTNRLIQTVGSLWCQNHPKPRIAIIDISLKGGGYFYPLANIKIDLKLISNNWMGCVVSKMPCLDRVGGSLHPTRLE